MGMEKKEQIEKERVEAVLNILKKHAPLTVKQEKFCSDTCVERFLRAKGDSVKKAARHLRAVLSWRDGIGIEHLIADEFSAELADGVAYVAGHDDDSRPVLVFRIKQDYPKFHSQKSFVRLLVFTLEVAISSMSRFVDQFVILFDASFYRSASAFLNLQLGMLKLISDYYPGRLHRAFVLDPPSLFPYLWKGVRPFVELSGATAVVVSLSSLDFEGALDGVDTFAVYPRAASLRFDTAGPAKPVGSASSRFSFTVSHMDALKPWYLSTTTRSAVVPTTAASPSLIGASPLNARSFSFASPAARSTPRGGGGGVSGSGRSIPSTPSSGPPPQRNGNKNQQQQQPPRTPRPSFLQSPAALFSSLRRGEGGQQHPGGSKGERERESFAPYLRFYRRPYDEMVYRAMMRPPLGGLVSIVNPHLNGKQRRHVNHHQRI